MQPHQNSRALAIRCWHLLQLGVQLGNAIDQQKHLKSKVIVPPALHYEEGKVEVIRNNTLTKLSARQTYTFKQSIS